MANLTQEQMKLLDEHARAQQEMMREQLERIGVQFRIAGPFEGDSSFPMEYTLRYSFVSAVGPTFDLAISSFVEQLLKYVPVEKAGQAEQVRAYNAEMDERARLIRENIDKPWLPLHDGE